VQLSSDGSVSGHVFRIDRVKGSQWYAKYRLADGRQIKRRIGPAWSGRGRPPEGFFSQRTAEVWLEQRLAEARCQAHCGTDLDATFAQAAEEWLRYVAEDRGCKPTTLRGYRNSVRNQLVPVFGDRRLVDIAARDIERWRAGLTSSPRTKNKQLTILHGIFKRARKVFGLTHNPAADVEKLRESRYVDLEVFSPEEVHALVRAAASEQDAAIYVTAAFTGQHSGRER
jgi:integrase